VAYILKGFGGILTASIKKNFFSTATFRQYDN
jgi:hypothetical protein